MTAVSPPSRRQRHTGSVPPIGLNLDPSLRWPPEIDLVERACRGERGALGEILRCGYPRVWAFCRGLGFSDEQSKEILSEVFEGVVRNMRTLRSVESFEGWFWAVVRNRLNTYLRRGRIEYPFERDLSPTTPEEELLLGEEHTQIGRAMGQLSYRERELLWLREVEGLSYRDMAIRFGGSVGAMRVAVHRARNRLRELYQEQEA